MDMTPDALALGLVWFVVFLFSVTVHEAAHALVAHRLGDETAYLGGQVTLNPVPHIQREPLGTIVVPIVSYLMFNWMMGWASAPYDRWWAERYPRRAAWMALAGPVSNLGLFLLAGLLIRIGLAADVLQSPAKVNFSEVTMAAEPGIFTAVAAVLSIAFSLNLLLFVFNMLPLAPLDGSGILPLVMPEDLAVRIQELLRQPAWSMLGLMLAWYFIGRIFSPFFTLALNVLYPGLGYH